MATKLFFYDKLAYTCESETVDTDYGPEVRIVVKDENDKVVHTAQEPASADTQIGWWKDEQEQIKQWQEDELSQNA